MVEENVLDVLRFFGGHGRRPSVFATAAFGNSDRCEDGPKPGTKIPVQVAIMGVI
jgi:hypothetical protein